MLIQQLQIRELNNQLSVSCKAGDNELTLDISLDCHFLVMIANCCSALSVALATVSSTKLPITDREIASRCSSLDSNFDTTNCRSR